MCDAYACAYAYVYKNLVSSVPLPNVISMTRILYLCGDGGGLLGCEGDVWPGLPAGCGRSAKLVGLLAWGGREPLDSLSVGTEPMCRCVLPGRGGDCRLGVTEVRFARC